MKDSYIDKLARQLDELYDVDQFKLLLQAVGHELEVVAEPGRRLNEISDAVRTAMREGWLEELVEKAREQRAKNTLFVALADDMLDQLRTERGNELALALAKIIGKHDVPEDTLFLGYELLRPSSEAFRVKRPAILDPPAALTAKLANAQAGGRFPLIEFAVYLRAEHHDEAFYRAVTSWLKQACGKLKLKPADIRHAQQNVDDAAARSQNRSVVLMISVWPANEVTDPRAAGNAPYLLSAWWRFIEPDGSLGEGEELRNLSPAPPENLAGVLDELTAEVAEVRAQTGGELVIELFLPVELMRDAVDQWQIGPKAKQPAVAVGAEHQVLLRSWNRTYQRDLAAWRADWKRRWNLHRNAVEASKVEDIDASFRARAPSVSQFALTFAPQPADYAEQGKIFTLLSIGTPVGLWPRCEIQAHAGDVADFLERLTKVPLPDWRNELLEVRRTAARLGGDHFGCHLTLLWDDPERLPPDQPRSQFRR